jgi:MoaA/NifB/PqqE/SkfB family radical SAM enzyme
MPGSWHQTVAGIRNLRACGVAVEATVGVTGPNLSHLRPAIDLLDALGVESVHLRYPAPRGRALADPDVIAPYPAGLAAIERALRGLSRPEVTIQGVPFCLLPAAVQRRARPLPAFLAPPLRRLKAKQVDRCRSCTELLACLGFWREEHEGRYQQAALEPALLPPDPP